MKKVILAGFLLLSLAIIFVLRNDDVIGRYDGNRVIAIEVGSWGVFLDVSNPEEQAFILDALSELEYSDYEASSITVTSVVYEIKLTYSNGEGCLITFDFDNNKYSVTPLDSEGNQIREESKSYSASTEELSEIQKLWK